MAELIHLIIGLALVTWLLVLGLKAMWLGQWERAAILMTLQYLINFTSTR